MGREHGWYGRGVAVALLAASVTVFFTWLIWMAARAIERVDERRRQAEESLRGSERQLADFFDNAAVALHWVGPDGTVLRVNDTELEMLGYSREEYEGRHIAEFHVSAEAIADILARLTAGEVITDYPAQLRRKDGSICDVLIHSSVYREDGKFIHTRCFTRDVTLHKRTEEALRRSMEEEILSRKKAEAASRAKDDFIAALSHELRTPLTPVLLAATDLADDPSLHSEAREQLVMICRNVELEARLIDDLLDLTRISRGKLSLNPARVDAHEVMRHAEEIVHADLAGRKLELHLLLEAPQSFVLADSARLQQVFWNLLKNAVKFTPDGGVITVRSSNPSTGRLLVSVSDTGRGIPPETLEKIFLPFDQGDLHGRHTFGGLGLGLAISKALVDLHEGCLTAHSEGAGKGAVFTVELPAAPENSLAENTSGLSQTNRLSEGMPLR
jgi:PAS domain S-box-containing protein